VTRSRRDTCQVDLLDDALVVLHDAVRDVDAQLTLRAQHRQPEPALQHDLVLGENRCASSALA